MINILKKNRYFNTKKGFTIIEFVVSMVILAIISLVIGMGFIQMIHGYFIAKGNASTSQNAQIVLARVVKELKSTLSITSGDTASITFDSESISSPPKTLVLSLDNTRQELSLGGDLLANHVKTFNLSYFDQYDKVSAPAGLSYLPKSTAIIKITLGLSGADNEVATFELRIFLSKVITGI
jgi:prepilin-type N-terminal cleavage/methylation domain-containing protein